MKALLFTHTGARFVAHAEPFEVPSSAEPGAWMEPPEGVRGLAPGDLAYWIDEELWEVELDAEARSVESYLAPRGRLLRRVERWDAIKPAFVAFCLERLDTLTARAPEAPRVAAHAATARRAAARQDASMLAFATASVAAAALGGDALDAREAAFDAERAHQSAWLARELGCS